MKYLISIHRPHGFDYARELGPDVRAEIDAVNDAMVAAGVRLFVGGLRSLNEAHHARLGEEFQSGAYLLTDEYVDGFWVVEVESEAAALEWGRRAGQACRAGVEVRPFHG